MDTNKITYFGETDSRNKKVAFGIKASDRSRHVYIIGKTGMGKSTLLENMAVQDIKNGEGMAFIDPHGKTAELLLEYVPESRIKDVIYFAPFDTDYPISFNVMEDVGIDKRHLVSNGLMSAFKKIWVDAWSARMEYILNNILLALLEYPNSTLLGVNRMLADKDYRNLVVANVKDPSVKAFWVDEFAKYGERYMQEAGAAIQNKIGQFVANPLVRNIIGQPKSTFDIRKVMDEKKILIINLSKGRVGEANANLIGSMLITKIYLAAMSRADTSESMMKKTPQFNLFVDEFQSFANESFADILSEARKYKLSLTIAHQYIEQMSDEVRAAVFGNVGTMITFRVGAYDAEVLEKEFSPQFTAEDLVNLGFIQIYLKLMIDGVTSQPFSATTLPPIEKPETSSRDSIIKSSRESFARPRLEVEEEIRAWHYVDKGAGRPPVKNNFSERRDNGNREMRSDRPERFERSESRPPERHERELSPEAPKKNPFADIVLPKSQGASEEGKLEEKPAIEEKPSVSNIPSHQQPASSNVLQKIQQKKNPKEPTEKNLSELRKVLESFKKKEEIKKEAIEGEKRPITPDPQIELLQQKAKEEMKGTSFEKKPEKTDVKPEENNKKKPPEIPEDVLRKMLEIDDK